MRILLVDDEPDLVSTLAARMALRGITADWVTSAEAALEAVDDQHYDLAVLDVRLPGTSGLELKKLLQVRAPDIKIIFLTGQGDQDQYRACLAAAGERFYLVKPIELDQLLKTIDVALGEKMG